MSRVLRFLENDFRRSLVWLAVIIVVFAVRTAVLNQPWQFRQTLLIILFVVMAEMIHGALTLRKNRRSKL